MLLFTFVPVSFALQLNGDDCWVGKQQQDIHGVCAWSAGATGRWHAEVLPRYTMTSDDALTVASPSPTGWPVHLHICGQRRRRLHYDTEWFRFHGHAARRLDTTGMTRVAAHDRPLLTLIRN